MTATPVPTVAAPVVLVEPTRAPVMQSAEFSFPVTEPTPSPSSPSAITQSAVQPRQATELDHESLHDQIARCLQFDAERGSPPGTSVYGVIMLRVVARNSCDVGFSGDEVWFEASAIPPAGGTAGREIGRFQTVIPARGFAETFIQIAGVPSDAFYYYKASLWWTTGGGRRAGE